MFFPLCAQVFTYLERWCAKHNFGPDHVKKVPPIHSIFVVDGRIDPCKISRNKTHEKRQSELRQLRAKIMRNECLPTDIERFKKLQRQATRPNGQLVTDLVAWIATKPYFTVFGAPWQADAQLVYLYRRFKWIEGIISEDSDMWTMGVQNWHAGYATCSTSKYRHVLGNKTNAKFMGDMTIAERIRFSMLTSNDYLPGLRGVGWETVKRLHATYERFVDADSKVS